MQSVNRGPWKRSTSVHLEFADIGRKNIYEKSGTVDFEGAQFSKINKMQV